jgi:hypothetical protein
MSRWFEVHLPSCDVEQIETIAYLAGMTWDEVFEAAALLGLSEWSKNPTRKISSEEMVAMSLGIYDHLGESLNDAADQVGWSSGYVEFDNARDLR